MKLSEIAERSGVSVQAVREYCRTHFDESRKTRSGWQLTEEEAQSIIDHYASRAEGSGGVGGESRKERERKGGESFAAVQREILDELRRQLEIKDGQIADLSASLKAAHESLHAAQALHGAEVMPRQLEATGAADPATPETPREPGADPERPTRWDYLVAAFTGRVPDRG